MKGSVFTSRKKVQFQIGDQVKMVNCMEADCYADEVWTVASEPWEVCGSMVVKLEGYRCGFDVTKLKRI